MTVQDISSRAVDGTLKLVRFPADRILNIAPQSRAAHTARLAIDRADAAVRGAAGVVLSNSELLEDADRRRAAAEDRGRAQRLRAKAETRVGDAEARAEQTRNEAEARRKKADTEAKRKQAQAEKQRDQEKARAAKTAEKRKEAARTNAAKTEEKLEQRGKVDRLEQLEKKSEALDIKERAVRAADEARRLENATAKTKARRKTQSGSKTGTNGTG